MMRPSGAKPTNRNSPSSAAPLIARSSCRVNMSANVSPGGCSGIQGEKCGQLTSWTRTYSVRSSCRGRRRVIRGVRMWGSGLTRGIVSPEEIMKAFVAFVVFTLFCLSPARAADEKAAAALAKERDGLPLVFHEDFKDAEKARARFGFDDPEAWKMIQDNGKNVLALVKRSNYKPPVRSIENRAWIKDLEV